MTQVDSKDKKKKISLEPIIQATSISVTFYIPFLGIIDSQTDIIHGL